VIEVTKSQQATAIDSQKHARRRAFPNGWRGATYERIDKAMIEAFKTQVEKGSTRVEL
jgi:hypothetical protein